MIPSERKLLGVLSNRDVTFFIPPYQRNYEWADDQCQVFLDDIVKTYKKNSGGETSEHFFGSVTFFKTDSKFGEPDKLVLIDGQQRITTTMLFLVAMRDIVEDDKVKTFLDVKYLKNDYASGENDEYKIKLKQVETDWPAYKNIILGEPLTESEKKAAVYHNYRFFINKLNELKQQIELKDLVTYGLEKFSLITIELQPREHKWENPQEIFESMNSLGKPLSLADLVRNYLLLGLDADKQEVFYKKYWLEIEKSLAGSISNYIRDYMQLRSMTSYRQATGVNYKELYGNFKGIFIDTEAEVILKELSEYARIYRWVLPNGKTEKSKKIDNLLTDLKYFKITTANSFLLALLIKWNEEKFTDDDLADILDAFRIYCIRRRLISLTQAENRTFPTLVKYLDELAESCDKREKMFEILSRHENRLRLPNDIEMTNGLESINFYNLQYAKTVLALIEEKLTKSRPDLSDPRLQIEHIMPQTLDNAWRKELGDGCESIHQELVNTIGNLTLIRHNQELGNKSFKEKLDVYENHAGLQIAKTHITDQTTWNETSIRSRAAWIIDFLLQQVLPIPDAMKNKNNFSIKATHGLSFTELQLIGEEIRFHQDQSIKAKVISDKEVEFEGKKWRLTPLTREIQTRRGVANKSGAYQGAQYWDYNGTKLDYIMQNGIDDE